MYHLRPLILRVVEEPDEPAFSQQVVQSAAGRS
jgi:hypothetical protein